MDVLEDINELFDEFAVSYKHSLYAISEAKKEAISKHENSRLEIQKKYARERSKITTATVNSLSAYMHKIDDLHSEMIKKSDSILRAAEFIVYGNAVPEKIDRLIFSETKIPFITPFLGHNNIIIESADDSCHQLGLQFTIRALQQTAAGQLSVTVLNPNLRPEFSCLSTMPDFRMLTETTEIANEISKFSKVILENDKLLLGRYKSLIELRNVSQQPIGKLQLLIMQDIPKEILNSVMSDLIKVTYGAPRAGIVVVVLNNHRFFSDSPLENLRKSGNFITFSQSKDYWKSSEYESLNLSFPFLPNQAITENIANIIEMSKETSVITLPFEQIENTDNMWTKTSVKGLDFALGKAGLDMVSIRIGDDVSQKHNILISGAAGQGKSNLLEVMIHSLCLNYSPSELELYLLDFKDGLTFKPYGIKDGCSWLPHARMLGLESARDVGLAVLKDLENERILRSNLFKNATQDGIHNYETYRTHYPEKILPRIVLIIDEYQKLFDVGDEISDEASALLENLVRQGRACAIHVILASQSITGTIGLIGKEDRIYGQFPIRIAMKNTVTESYSLFGMGNDSAATLRVRGEAIINMNYGAIDSNQKFTVAYASPDEMRNIRKLFCMRSSLNKFPIVFGRQDLIELPMILTQIKKWRQEIANGAVVKIPCGMSLSVNKNVLSISMPNDIGKNIALLGSGENVQDGSNATGKNNIAIGYVQSIAFSLAMQHPLGNARFVVFNGVQNSTWANSNMERWKSLMERFGFPVEVVGSEHVSEWLMAFEQQSLTSIPDEDTYIFGIGMDRFNTLSERDLSGASGADSFRQLLKMGNKGIHLICWWSNTAMYNEHIGFGNDGYINTKILLRMDADTSRDVLGPFIKWNVRDNRAYIHDSSDLAEDSIVLPVIPLTNRACGLIETESW